MVKKSVFCLILAFLILNASACSTLSSKNIKSATLVITQGTVIDGTGSDPIPNGLVAVRDNRILAVGRAQDFNIPEGIVIIDAEGDTILPGIINSHAHSVSGAGTRRLLFLLDGVTSVCDMMISIQMMSDLDQEGIQAGPASRGFKSGPMITAPGGYPGVIFGSYTSYEISGEEQAEQAVNEIFENGADYIKIALEPGIFGDPWPVLTAQEVRAIVKSAHQHDLLVRAHVNNAALDIALEGGVDVIEHVAMPSFSYQDLEPFFDEAGAFQIPDRYQEQLLQMIDQGTILVPTLDVIIHDSYLEGGMEPPEIAVVEAILTVVGFYHDAGGTIALGNDYGNSGVEPGMPLNEMKFLLLAGLSPMEVLVTGTQTAAFVCGQGEDLGTLEAGKVADIIVIDGDPLVDISVMDSVFYVIKDGEIVVNPDQENK
jgi:imidazolonepropionase-like amidohydrolase